MWHCFISIILHTRYTHPVLYTCIAVNAPFMHLCAPVIHVYTPHTHTPSNTSNHPFIHPYKHPFKHPFIRPFIHPIYTLGTKGGAGPHGRGRHGWTDESGSDRESRIGGHAAGGDAARCVHTPHIIYPVYTFITIYTPMYTLYTCIYTIYTPYIHLRRL